jgi:uncharacterized protein YbjT (DUF2867 family)
MPTSTSLTLVLGATGKTGSRVASRLLSRGLPVRTAGAQYALTGPEALTIAAAAKIISDVSGQATDYTDIDRDEWVAAAVAGGAPAEYGAVLRLLTETIASGHGSRPSRDVEKATGAAPASFADFARRTAAARAAGEAR